MLGLTLGILVGLLELIPNAHPQTLALVILPLLGMPFLDNVLFVTALLTISLHLNTLSHTYHPIPKAILKAAEPAQRMAYQGLGWWATRLQLEAIPAGLVQSLPLVIILSLLPIKSLLLPATLLLAVLAVIRAKRKLGALVVLTLALLTGLLAQGLHHEGMVPLLTGLFTLPPLLHLLVQAKAEQLPAQTEPMPIPEDEEPQTQSIDTALGVAAAILPGISASSLAHLRTNQEQVEPWTYLSITAPQKAAGAFAALLLLATQGSPHSGLAVALFGQAPKLPPVYTFIVMALAMVILLPLGAWLTNKAEGPYLAFVQKMPQKLLAVTLLPVAIGTVFYHANSYGLVLAALACTVSLLQKQWHVPNQILLQAITIPVVLSIAG